MQPHGEGLDFDGLKHVLSLAVRGAPYDETLQSLLDEARRLIGAQAWAAHYLLDEAAGRLRLNLSLIHI